MHEVQEIEEYEESAQDIQIKPIYQMGEGISERVPLLVAELDGSIINEDDLHIVLDGVSYPATYDEQASTISFQIEEPLKEKFHVVTFVANNERETRVFYVR